MLNIMPDSKWLFLIALLDNWLLYYYHFHFLMVILFLLISKNKKIYNFVPIIPRMHKLCHHNERWFSYN